MTLAELDWSILGPALLAGLLVLVTHVPLGLQVLERGIVFVDLAIAQIAGLGVIAADALGLPEGGLAVQGAAVAAALAGAALLTWTERRAPREQEALIGVAFVLAACAGIVLLAGNPHGGEHLKDLLVGQILWVDATRLGALAAVSAALLALRATGLLARAGRFGFYASLAVAVTASVQVVGVYLVFSSLIVPALAARGWAARRRADARARVPEEVACRAPVEPVATGPEGHRARESGVIAYLVGALGYGAGLVASALLDLPSGATIVWSLAACALLSLPASRLRRPAHQ